MITCDRAVASVAADFADRKIIWTPHKIYTESLPPFRNGVGTLIYERLDALYVIWIFRPSPRRFRANAPATHALSGRLCALGVDVECIEGLTGSHEQAVFLGAPETKIGAGFRDMNSADELAIGREHVHSVKTFASPSGSGPNVAVHIATNTVR